MKILKLHRKLSLSV